MALKFEVTNGMGEFACRVKGKVYRFEAGEHELEDPPAKLVEAISCAHFAGVGVVVSSGLDKSAVEDDKDSLKLVEAFQEQQLAKIDELRASLADESDPEKAQAIRDEIGEIRLVHPVEVGE